MKKKYINFHINSSSTLKVSKTFYLFLIFLITFFNVAISSAQTISSFSPSSACSNSGASVIINGTGFTGATAVKFDGVTATFSIDVSGNQITATLPAGATTGLITVTPFVGSDIISSGTFTVDSILPANVTIAASANPICVGSSVTFTASPINGGATPAYQWKLNNVNVGTNATTYTNATLANGDSVTCVITSNATPCLTGSPATSSPIVMTVKPRPIATGTNTTQTICSGTPITTMVLSSSIASTTFTWSRDNTTAVTGMGNTGNGNITGTLINGTALAQTVTFQIIPITNGCSGPAITATVIVNPTPNAVATNPTPNICSGLPLNITLSGGVTGTTYAWTRDNATLVTGIPSGSGNISGILINTTGVNQTVNFTITPTANTCPGATTTATVIVQPSPIITVQPVAPAAICNGGGNASISVTATGGSTYQWRKNGVNLTNTATYSTVTTATLGITSPAASENGASFDVVITSATGCTVTSTAVALVVSGAPTPTIEFTENTGDTTYNINVCGHIAQSENDLDIVAGNPGGALQWQVSTDNGVTFVDGLGPTSTQTQYVFDPVYTNYESVPGVYKFRLKITINGCFGYSNIITLTVSGVYNLTAGTVAGNQNSCTASYNPLAFTVVTAPTGGIGTYTYQWQSSTDNINFTNIASSNIAAYDPPTAITQTTYYRRITISDGCSAIGSNTITVFINATASITLTSAPPTSICANSAIANITYSCQGVSGATVTGLPAGVTGTLTSGVFTISGTPTATGTFGYTVTTSGGCSTNPTASGTITVNALPTAIIGANQTICSGGTASFSVALTGTAPWNITYSNGTTPTTVTGIATSPYTFTVAGITTNKVYTITALSDSKCTAIAAGITGSATVTVSIGTAGVWTGAVSTDWFDCRNWAGGLPSSTINADIPANMPVIIDRGSPFAAASSFIASAQDLILGTNATLTFSSSNASELQVSRDWKNSGIFNPGTGIVTFNGATANQIQTINLGIKTNETFYRLTINTSNGAKGVNVVDKFDLRVLNSLSLTTGDLRLTGEAQLIQAGLSNPNSGLGKILIDQQGQKNSFNYNYWSSPVSSADNATYSVVAVLKDGTDVTTNPFSPGTITFGDGVSFADGTLSSPIKISNQWLYSYNSLTPVSNTDLQNYYLWNAIGSTVSIKKGEGFIMKGTGGAAAITALQNYVFVGRPNSGDISLPLPLDQTYLIGNPYPSALDANKFIRDNLKDCTSCTNTVNVFNGALYFWDHFGLSNNHNLVEYVGGYATYSLMGGVIAKSSDPLTANNGSNGSKIPKQYIPVAQGFFVDAYLDSDLSGAEIPTTVNGGTLYFKNSQRAFNRESSGSSLFMKTSETTKTNPTETDKRSKIRLGFDSAVGAHRQLLVGADRNTTNQFDIGYDAPMFDLDGDDMFWEISNSEFVIQGVPNFDDDQIIPFGLNIANAGLVTVKIDALENVPSNTKIYLFDNTTKSYHNIKNNPFAINLAIGEYNNRFSLRFTNKKHNVEPHNFKDGISVLYSRNYKILIIQNKIEDAIVNKVYLFNLSGLAMANWDVENQDQTSIQIPIKNVNPGIYIVKIQTSKGNFSKKIMIK